MISLIYVEEEALDFPLTEFLRKKFSRAQWITIRRYGDIFNRTSQNFRLQKSNPALILAKKHKNFYHKTPPTYGIGTLENYYFSHLLNCPFDCRYCFLQAMYRSAHFVLFVNYEDFQNELTSLFLEKNDPMTIFTGYDGDSLALENITGFIEHFYPFFEKNSSITFELRTKSSQVECLLQRNPLPNLVTAFSLNPQIVVSSIEKKTPSLSHRLKALSSLQKAGFKIGLRFDPLISFADSKSHYQAFFDQVFDIVDPYFLHSVTLGSYRMPKEFKKRMESLFPLEPLVHSYQEKEDFFSFCEEQLKSRIHKEVLFRC